MDKSKKILADIKADKKDFCEMQGKGTCLCCWAAGDEGGSCTYYRDQYQNSTKCEKISMLIELSTSDVAKALRDVFGPSAQEIFVYFYYVDKYRQKKNGA